MRIDKYLKVSRIVKRRTIAKELVAAGRITKQGKAVKPSYQVQLNDILVIRFGNKLVTIEVLVLNENAAKAVADHMYKLIKEERVETDGD